MFVGHFVVVVSGAVVVVVSAAVVVVVSGAVVVVVGTIPAHVWLRLNWVGVRPV